MTTSAVETQAVAEKLATILKTGDTVVLLGDLGAGKTCFTQGLARGLGVADRVTSPTFTLVNRYDGRLQLQHLDVYRLNGFSEALDLDLHEMAEDGVTVIEWGHNIIEALPASRLEIELVYGDNLDDGRLISLRPLGESWQARLDKASGLLRPWRVQ